MCERQHPPGRAEDPAAEAGSGEDQTAPADPGRVDPEIGDGEASELETIKFQVNWSRTPEKHDISGTPVAAAAVAASGTGSETSGRTASAGSSRSSETETATVTG